MSHIVREGGRPLAIAANGTATLGGNHIMGFLAVVSGTLTVTVQDGSSGAVQSVVVVDAVPVTAGIYTPIPIVIPAVPQGIVVTLAGGAKGTLII